MNHYFSTELILKSVDHYNREGGTSSLVSGMLAVALRATRGAVMLLKHSCFSGGGPPFGWPRIINASPERT